MLVVWWKRSKSVPNHEKIVVRLLRFVDRLPNAIRFLHSGTSHSEACEVQTATKIKTHINIHMMPQIFQKIKKSMYIFSLKMAITEDKRGLLRIFIG